VGTLRAENLGKAYRVYKRPIDSLKEIFLRREYAETFWALRDVSFELEPAHSLGVIGDNGAGKSTLLKLLAGALAPTTGSIQVSGRMAALLSLGGGFHPDLSGIDNIRIGCAVLGLSPAQTDALIPDVVEFSELGDFVHRPVRTYSSGMHLRLGFSVATALTPDILVIDEHLSVGDQHFRLKCKRRIMDLREGGSSIVLCSHDLHTVMEVCERTMWLRSGRPAMLGDSQEVLSAYQDAVRRQDEETDSHSRGQRTAPTMNCLRDVAVGGDIRGGTFVTGGRLELRITARLAKATRNDGVFIAVLLLRSDGLRCYGTTTRADGVSDGIYSLGGDEYGVTLVIDELPLLGGNYSFTIALQDMRSPHTYDHRVGAASFSVSAQSRGEGGVVRIAHRWERP
jgi:lipopolysaccharide transport system ATP-binding protein